MNCGGFVLRRALLEMPAHLKRRMTIDQQVVAALHIGSQSLPRSFLGGKFGFVVLFTSMKAAVILGKAME